MNSRIKSIIIRIIIILIGISIFRTFQTGEPTIYTEMKHDKSQLLESIEHLKKITLLERIIALSDSVIANFIKIISNKINEINYDYYYVVDYCIDYHRKNEMLSSMTLDEWYDFKQNISTWRRLQQGSVTLGTYVSQGYRKETLEGVEKWVLTE